MKIFFCLWGLWLIVMTRLAQATRDRNEAGGGGGVVERRPGGGVRLHGY